MNPNLEFWRGRRVLLTGHTGFKGAWTAVWLAKLGARVTGFALQPETTPNLWSSLPHDLLDREIIADVRDLGAVRGAVADSQPEIVLHLAAQALVRRSFAEPVETYATNLMGTVNLLDSLRGQASLKAVLVVTTDKVYANANTGRDFVETDPLGGHDPYSASKAAAELATASYAHSFFSQSGVAVGTARAGNVIGGGDWSQDRLVPDVWRAAKVGEAVTLRSPDSTRPWQHVLEPVAGYLRYAEALADGKDTPAALNFGPVVGDTATVAHVATVMAEALGAETAWRQDDRPAPPEMKLLSLDPTAAAGSLAWRPRLSCEEAVRWSAEWYRAYDAGEEAHRLCQEQIALYEAIP